MACTESYRPRFSPFNKPFKEDIDEWNDKLMYVSECPRLGFETRWTVSRCVFLLRGLDQWLKVQRAAVSGSFFAESLRTF